MKVQLPIDSSIPEIINSLKESQNLILLASPGAGKTTRVAPALLSHTSKKILMLQPRRIAARASAERIAEENQWELGQEVGYRVRFEDCTSDQSRLIIVTEALLMKELQRDPDLTDFEFILLDEFHERNLYSDAGIAALRELQQLSRPDLKIIVMSATIDPKPLLEYLEPAQKIEVPGRIFPVEVIYDGQSQLLNTDRTFIERVVQKILLAQQSGLPDKHILVFLPGLSEIQRVEESLLKRSQTPTSPRRIFKLHGSLSLKEQHEVLHSREAKIILATNVAETSLTIDGVDTVIDSGLARELQNDQRRLFPWLKTTRISRASAEQRKGRAGRQGPGRCFRLWTKLDDQSMAPFAPPDIQTQDLSDLLLTLCQLGVSDPQTFSWFEKPPVNSLERSKTLLFQLGFLDRADGLLRLSPKGQWSQRIPLPPRLASLLYEGQKLNLSYLAIPIAALLNERDPWTRENLDSWLSACGDSDLIPRLEALQQRPLPREFQIVERTTKQLARLIKKEALNPTTFEGSLPKATDSLKDISRLLFSSFSDRVARRRRPLEKAALVVGQKGVELSPQSLVRQSEFFFALSGHANEANGNAIVDLAHPFSKAQLQEAFANEISLRKEPQYSVEKEAWQSIEQKYFRDLPIEEPSVRPLELTPETLLSIAREAFLGWKTEESILEQWYLRLGLAQQLWPQTQWPELDQWERDTLEMACMGENSLSVVKNKNWSELFSYPLGKLEKQLLEEELPARILTPRGKSFPLHYNINGTVNLELKIQEAFGWKETPTIAKGQIKIRLSLLGPHMRPLQTTDDLASFWKGTYQELRPSLKARYPRHSWPEDPSVL